jgi:hypothetical protein
MVMHDPCIPPWFNFYHIYCCMLMLFHVLHLFLQPHTRCFGSDFWRHKKVVEYLSSTILQTSLKLSICTLEVKPHFSFFIGVNQLSKGISMYYAHTHRQHALVKFTLSITFLFLFPIFYNLKVFYYSTETDIF